MNPYEFRKGVVEFDYYPLSQYQERFSLFEECGEIVITTLDD